MVRTLLTVKKQIKLALSDIKLKPHPHNHDEVQIYIKDEFVGYSHDVSELIRTSKIEFKDKTLSNSKGVFKIDVLGPTIHDVSEGALLLLPDDKAYLLDIDVQKHLGINTAWYEFNPVITKEIVFILCIVAAGFAGIYYRDVIAVDNNQNEQCKDVIVK